MKASAKRAERIEADLLALEKRVARALRRVGKVTISSGISRGLSVESAAGSCLRVTVQHEARPWVFADNPASRYVIRVDGVEDANFRSKHRARAFKGFGALPSADTLAPVVACVEKHLAFKDAAEVERAERETAAEKRKELDGQLDALLRAIGERHGVGTSYRDDELQDGNLRVRRQNDGYAVDIVGLSEPDLERVLTFWRAFPRSSS